MPKPFQPTPLELSTSANKLYVIHGKMCSLIMWQIVSKYSVNVSDSDEKEFEDDPLLQVLRKQRTWVKEQIR